MARLRVPLSDPPDRLNDAERAWLRDWAAAHAPWSVSRLLELEECCLDHFRANGKRMKRWDMTVKNWVRNERRFWRVQPESRPRLPLFELAEDAAVDELRKRRELHRLRLVGR